VPKVLSQSMSGFACCGSGGYNATNRPINRTRGGQGLAVTKFFDFTMSKVTVPFTQKSLGDLCESLLGALDLEAFVGKGLQINDQTGWALPLSQEGGVGAESHTLRNPERRNCGTVSALV